MAKPKLTTQFNPNADEAQDDAAAEAIEPQSVHDLIENADELEAINEALEQLAGQEAWLTLERRPPEEDVWQMIPDKILVANFDLRKVAKNYGGGDYKAKFKRANGQNFGVRKFTIDHRIEGKLDRRGDGGQAPDTTRIFSDALNVFERLQARNQTPAPGPSDDRNMDMMLLMMKQSQETNLAVLQGVFATMAAMFQGGGAGGNGSGGVPVMEVLKMIKQPDPIEQIKYLRQLKDFNEPQEKEETTVLDSILKAVPSILGKFSTPSLPPNVPDASGNPAAAPSQSGPSDKYQKLFAKFLERALKAARRDADPFPYWEQLDSIPPEEMERIKLFLQAPDWFEQLFGGQFTHDAQVKDWFDDLRELILNDGDESCLDNGGDGDNGPAPSGNQKPSDSAPPSGQSAD